MSKHMCHHDDCGQRATDRCFECGEWLCMAHLTHVELPTAEATFAELLCVTCVQEHLAHTDPYGRIVVESPAPPAIFR